MLCKLFSLNPSCIFNKETNTCFIMSHKPKATVYILYIKRMYIKVVKLVGDLFFLIY